MTGSTVGLGVSAAMRQVEEDIALAAGSDVRVLISGESGVGKGIVACRIHERGRRSASRFVPVDCDGVSDPVLGAELFGRVPTGAWSSQDRRRGAFEAARGGTLFLDGIGGISPSVQCRLLRFIETGEIQPIGADRPLTSLDVRVIAATPTPLDERVVARKFREDLFYRLNVVHIVVPPLRERREDVPVLFNDCLRHFAGRAGTAPPQLTSEAWEHLTEYTWPRNVRELRNVAERLVRSCGARRADVNDLPAEIVQQGAARPAFDVRPAPIRRRLVGRRLWVGQLARQGFRYARVH